MSKKRTPTTAFSSRIRALKMLVFDFDGVFTDGRVITDETGREAVICSRKDTLRLPELKAAGIKLAVISKERNPVVAARCRKMKLPYASGVDEKLGVLRRLLKRRQVSSGQTGYVGDDLNDLACLQHAGVAFTVADAAPECKAAADYITVRRGGDHAVREICDLILGELSRR